MTRRIADPPGSWAMQIEIPYPMGLEQGGLIFTRGQCDHDREGRPRNVGDIAAQIATVIQHQRTIWQDLEAPQDSLVRLVAFYRRDAGLSRSQLTEHLRTSLAMDSMPTVIPVPLEALSYPGLAVEVDFWGALETPREPVFQGSAKDHAGDPDAIVSGELIFLAAQLPLDARGRAFYPDDVDSQLDLLGNRLAEVLNAAGAGLDDLVKLVTYARLGDDAAAWERLARRRAGWFDKRAPVVTDVPLTSLDCPGAMLQVEGIALRPQSRAAAARRAIAPPGLAQGQPDLPHPPALACAGLFFTGGQLAWDDAGAIAAPGALVPQTKLAMERIAALLDEAGLGFGDVVKANTYYRGTASEALLHENMAVRNAYYRWPGPGSTGVPLAALPHPDAMTSVEVMAVAARTQATPG